MLDALPTDPSNSATIQIERFGAITAELQALFSDMWSDMSRDQSLPPMEVDYDNYVRLEGLGVLRTFTVRWQGELVGAMVFFVAPNMHHRSSLWATCDVVWIRPDMRKPMVGMRLVRYAEITFEHDGVNVLRMGTKIKHPALGRLLEYLGWTPVEVSWQKVLS